MPLPLWDKHKEKEAEKIEPEGFDGKTLGGKIGNTLIRFIRKIINSTSNWFEERLVNFAVGVLVKVETSGKTVFAPLIKYLEEMEAIPDFLAEIIKEVKDPQHEIGAALASQVGGSAIGGLMGAIFDPIMAPTKYQLNYRLHPYIADVSQGVYAQLIKIFTPEQEENVFKVQGWDKMYFPLWKKLYKNKIGFSELTDLKLRGELSDEEFNTGLRELGFDDMDLKHLLILTEKILPTTEAIINYFRTDISIEELYIQTAKNGISKEMTDQLITVNERLLGLSDIKAIYYRENKDDKWLSDQLEALGHSKIDIEDIKKILPYFPSVSDLVTFAVREVYYPDYAAKYGLMDEYPEKYEQEALKTGLPPEQAKNYWMSHWILPSIGQGYEMLHRGVIGSEELGDMFKAVDIMPYWRSRLEKISYRTYSRVDVRRMYRDGVLSVDEVLRAYKDLGYDDEKAEKMTEFTIAFYTADEKELTRAEITDGYKRQYFTEEETLEMIVYLGYTEDQAKYFTSKIDYAKEIDKKKTYLSLIKSEYKNGVKTESEVISRMTELGFKATEIDYHLEYWGIEKEEKPERPSKADLKSWISKKIITRDIFIEEMRNLGFADKYIEYYLADVKQKGL